MQRILEGIKVVDWTQWHAGSEAASFLGDLRADVYKVEQKGVGDHFCGHRAFGGMRY